MTPERWDKVKALFDAALAKAPSERHAFLESACPGDAELRSEVKRILADYDGAGSFLEKALIQPDTPFNGPNIGSDRIGQTVSHYRILEKLGQGGMGVVYKAQDTVLGRYVALKFLPAEVAMNAERKRRLIQEARAASALNHPNIITIHEISSFEGSDFIAMEYVDGQTLDRIIAHKRSKLATMLNYALQVADALSAAHAAGIVHRDLKPSNIIVDGQDRVKVLDFGLAKVAAAKISESKSTELMTPQTEEGAIVGTLAYMSPEQARGKPVDKQTDIWAFGCVLYEMLTTQQPFSGEGPSDLLAAVLKTEPDWMALPRETSPIIVRLLRRCLAKGPRDRLRDMGDARLEIEDALTTELRATPDPPVANAGRRAMFVLIALSIIAASALGWAAWVRMAATRSAISWSGALLGGSSQAMGPRISPDGKTLAFQAVIEGQTQLAVLKPESGNWTVLTYGASRGAISGIAWSRDSTKIYFDRMKNGAATIFSTPVLGGDERLVIEDAMHPEALPDGTLLFLRRNTQRQLQAHRFWPDAARIEALPASGVGRWLSQLRVFRDGTEAVYFGRPSDASLDVPDALYAIDLTAKKSRLLARVSPTEINLQSLAIAVSEDDRTVLINVASGNLSRVIGIPRDGSGKRRDLLSLTIPPWYMDVGPDGSIYVDQPYRLPELVRFGASESAPEKIAVSASFATAPGVLPLPDGRTVVPSRAVGRERLLVVAAAKTPAPLIDTNEETAAPVTMVGDREVAFLAGTAPHRTVTVATVKDGRIVRRLAGVKNQAIDSLTCSANAKVLYYAASGSIWAIPVVDGQPRKIREGDGVAVGPSGDLIIQLNRPDGVHLVQAGSASGALSREIAFQTEWRPTILGIGPSGIDSRGLVVLSTQSFKSWFWQGAILQPATGKVQRMLVYDGDVMAPAWAHNGSIVAIGVPLHSEIWQFRPEGTRLQQSVMLPWPGSDEDLAARPSRVFGIGGLFA